jgi:hypothetical protein
MTPEQRKSVADQQLLPKKQRLPRICPFQTGIRSAVFCKKPGGVCTIRVFRKEGRTGVVAVAEGSLGCLTSVCPKRFLQDDTIFAWVGETILGNSKPLIVKEVNFLQRQINEALEDMTGPEFQDVGRIDHVLLHPTRHPLEWCALEIQSVYFSGEKMIDEFKAIGDHATDIVPFPVHYRRPDYRSSGPKRLMPQLQTKVPSLRRWGRKMAVVVDEGFFNSLGKMDTVKHVSNCDIAWFVVRFDESHADAVLARGEVHLTTLERSVEGLTGGAPVSRAAFEDRILKKLYRRA